MMPEISDVDELNRAIDRMERTIVKLESKIEKLESKIETLEGNYSSLRNSMIEQGWDVEDLQRQITELSRKTYRPFGG